MQLGGRQEQPLAHEVRTSCSSRSGERLGRGHRQGALRRPAWLDAGAVLLNLVNDIVTFGATETSDDVAHYVMHFLPEYESVPFAMGAIVNHSILVLKAEGIHPCLEVSGRFM